MRENFLHYIWQFQKFDHQDLKTSCGKLLMILNPGEPNYHAGPDFFNGRIRINGQLWAGNIEIHLKSSGWYEHDHHNDHSYDNVILHVVWRDDAEVRHHDGSRIPCLSLAGRVSDNILTQYETLFNRKQKWINCEAHIKANVKVAFKDWFSFLIKQRLYYKMEIIKEQLRRSNNNWEAVLFQLLAKYFGSGLNSEAFYTMARQLDFKMVQKLKQDPLALEALFFGITGLFNKTADDEYYNQLKTTYSFLRRKFELENHQLIPLRFFRLRPASFPTIRLSQLAQLYSKSNGLFEQLTTSQDLDLLRNVFEIKASEFWNDHYRFEVVSKHRPKNLSVNFINSILINVVIPLQYVYHETKGKSFINRGLNLMRQIPAESNSILSGFKGLGIELEHAYDTQSLLHLYNNYCSKNNCLECDIGNEILNRNM